MNDYNDLPNYYNQNGYNTASQVESEVTFKKYVASVMRRTYTKMCLGLLVTAITAVLILSSPAVMSALFSSTAVFWVLMALELGVVIYLSARIEKLSNGTATALFYAYSVLNGVTLAPLFLVYTGESIALTFFITAGTFGAMSIYGYVTKQDLTKFGSYLIMALLGLIVASVVNLFMHSSTMEWIISLVGVAIFVGLTAWDAQTIKRMAATTDPSMVAKVSTWGALSLYLDFINLFLYLLRFFGSTRD